MFAGLEIAERRDRQAAKRSPASKRGSKLIAAEARSKAAFAEAHAWAVRAGFGERSQMAAAAALMLRYAHGAGNVTVAMVRERLEVQGR